jgi:iron complex transport system permease protein
VTLYLISALLTAVAVTTAGTVGFIGLVVPHLVRLKSGADHRALLPSAALAGGSLLVIADTIARTVVAPQQLPVGAITAVIGVPLFLFLLGQTVHSQE